MRLPPLSPPIPAPRVFAAGVEDALRTDEVRRHLAERAAERGPLCTCDHHARDHLGRTWRCTGKDSYGRPCACPSLEPAPDLLDGDGDGDGDGDELDEEGDGG